MERVRLDALGSVCHGITNSFFATRLGLLADSSVRSQISVLFWLTLAFLLCVNMMHLVLVISLFITFVLFVLLLHLLLLLHEKHFLNLLFSELLVNHFLFGREIIFLDLLPASFDLQLLLFHLIVFFHALPILELIFLNLLVLNSPAYTQSLDSLIKKLTSSLVTAALAPRQNPQHLRFSHLRPPTRHHTIDCRLAY